MTGFVPAGMRRLTLMACVALAGCGGGGGGGGGGGTAPSGDVTRPQVSGVSPSGVEVDIADAEQIAVVFSETIDSNSINSGSFKVAEAASGVPVSGSIGLETSTIPPNPSTARFMPAQPLARSKEYRVTLTTAIKDLAGNALAADHNASFTTITDKPWTATSVTLDTASPRWDHAAVWTGSEMIVFGGFVGFGVPATGTGARYNPATDTWTAIPSVPSIAALVAAVWTGSEMIVWTGFSGARYNPIINMWTAVSQTGAPPAFLGPTAVWTGTEMIVWGGSGPLAGVNTGGRFNPTSNSWLATNSSVGSGVPEGRERHSVVWTGTEMIVWGGISFHGGGPNPDVFGDGARYNPTNDTWTPVSNTGAPSPRFGHSAVWTGQEMIVWGASGEDGARYNPATNTWLPLPSAGFRLAFLDHTAIWTGTEMIVWGGRPVQDGSLFKLGGRYNPATNTWRPVTKENNSLSHESHTAVWTGAEMIIWGGHASTSQPQIDPPGLQTGARYEP